MSQITWLEPLPKKDSYGESLVSVLDTFHSTAAQKTNSKRVIHTCLGISTGLGHTTYLDA
jgi:hypothetical protein